MFGFRRGRIRAVFYVDGMVPSLMEAWKIAWIHSFSTGHVSFHTTLGRRSTPGAFHGLTRSTASLISLMVSSGLSRMGGTCCSCVVVIYLAGVGGKKVLSSVLALSLSSSTSLPSAMSSGTLPKADSSDLRYLAAF